MGCSDSPDLVFQDLTDWSVVEPNGFPDYRYNDREIIRAFADNSAATYEFLVAHGVVFVDKAPDTYGGHSVGNSVPREMHCAPMDWPLIQYRKAGRSGASGDDVERQRSDASARSGGAKGRRGNFAVAQDDLDPSAGPALRSCDRDRRGQRGKASQHSRAPSRDHRYGRFDRPT